MLWIIISSILLFLITLYAGFRKLIFLDQITPRSSSVAAIVVLFLFLVLRFLYDLGHFHEVVAVAFMSSSYAAISGFLIGFAIKQFRVKSSLKEIQYVNRSFLIDILPNVIALTLIIAGIARTSLLTDLNITPIRMTSGLSMIALGFFGITLRLIPEFRRKGLIILDRAVHWDNVLAYRWHGDEVLEIDFELDGVIKAYKTIIPPEDHVKIETLLATKMLEKQEEEND